MGGKPRVDLQAGGVFDTIDLGPYRLRVDLLRKDGKPIPYLRIEGGSIESLLDTHAASYDRADKRMRIDLRIGYDDSEPVEKLDGGESEE